MVSNASASAADLSPEHWPAATLDRFASGRLVQPFDICVDAGRYWLTRLKSRPETAAMVAIKEWLQQAD
jgi:LysR family transcriptional regulator of beta-lactamase